MAALPQDVISEDNPLAIHFASFRASEMGEEIRMIREQKIGYGIIELLKIRHRGVISGYSIVLVLNLPRQSSLGFLSSRRG
jgi:hypothetical protein